MVARGKTSQREGPRPGYGREDGRTSLLYRGGSSVLRDLQAAGWNHVGDPDSALGYVFDCFQGHLLDAKLFTASTPHGNRFDFPSPAGRIPYSL